MKASQKPKMEKVGFWCPPDVYQAVRGLMGKGVYPDQSKAVVGLLREALRHDAMLPESLQEKVNALAALLQRDPETVIRQCVEGIIEMAEAGKPILPIVVEEVRLRNSRGQSIN